VTRTEDRLTAALQSAAAAVDVEALRLREPGQSRPGRAGPRWRGLAGHAPGRRAWLAVMAASIAVAAASLVLILQAPPPGPVLEAAYIGGSEPKVPAFFVDAGSTGLYDQKLRVVSLAAGAVTATEHAPAGTQDITFLAEQAQTGNFVAAFQSSQAGGQVLYRFSITGTGKITPLTRIKGVVLRQQAGNLAVLALSPDGSRLALSLTPNTVAAPGVAASDEVIVLNLRNGARQVWRDTLADGKYEPQIASAVWTPAGQALVFASHLCKLSAGPAPCFWQIRRLTLGRQPHAGRVLLRLDGLDSVIQAPAISPDGGSVVEVRGGTAPGADTRVIRISLATGEQSVLHQWRAPGPYQVGANEGNFLVVGQQLHSGNNWLLRGWIDGAGFHALRYPPAS
jgi:hypothetical protein